MRVAALPYRAADADAEAPQLLRSPRRLKRRSLHGAQFHLDPHRPQIIARPPLPARNRGDWGSALRRQSRWDSPPRPGDCFALAGSYGYGSIGSANSKVRGNDAPRRRRGPQASRPRSAPGGRGHNWRPAARAGHATGTWGPTARGNPDRTMPIPPEKANSQPGVPFHLLGRGDIQDRRRRSTSPFFSMASRVVLSGTLLNTSRLTWGTLRQ